MLKYTDVAVTLREIPTEITLCINIANCPCHCEGCHSSYLSKDEGDTLTYIRLMHLIESNKGITTVCFMGGDGDVKLINHYARLIKESTIDKILESVEINKDMQLPKVKLSKGDIVKWIQKTPNPIKVGWYSGRQELSTDIQLENFDYIKLGPYIKAAGPLDSPTTNQRLYKIDHTNNTLEDITSLFWKERL